MDMHSEAHTPSVTQALRSLQKQTSWPVCQSLIDHQASGAERLPLRPHGELGLASRELGVLLPGPCRGFRAWPRQCLPLCVHVWQLPATAQGFSRLS